MNSLACSSAASTTSRCTTNAQGGIHKLKATTACRVKVSRSSRRMMGGQQKQKQQQLSLCQKDQKRRWLLGGVVRSSPGVDDLDDYDENGEKGENIEDLSPAAKFFGIYLQLGVWIAVLSFAGFTGYKKILETTDGAQEVGLLIAPTSAALFLIGTFSLYFFTTQKKED